MNKIKNKLRKIRDNLYLRIWYKIKNYIPKDIIFSEYTDLFKINRLIKNINIDLLQQNQKRVLISYIHPYLDLDFNNCKISHTNIYESSLIVKYFIEKGFCIDLIYVFPNVDEKFFENSKYDVIFGFGKPFLSACKSNPSAKKIIYLTENAPAFSKTEEQKRCDYYFIRHGVKESLKRSGLYYNDETINIADKGLLIGNEFTSSIYKKYFPNLEISTLTPTGLINKKFTLNFDKKDLCSFVWFGSYGAIHKGLDILLDVFKQDSNLKLYVCGLNPDEEYILKDYLDCSNIKNCGSVEVTSSDYLDLIDKCTYVISPSASEGMSTSVLTNMLHGLIPVVTKACGIDVCDFGYILEDYKVEYILKRISEITKTDKSILESKQKKAYEYARNNCTLEAYKQNLSKKLDFIIEEKQ